MFRFLLPLIFLLSIPDADAHNREAIIPAGTLMRVVPLPDKDKRKEQELIEVDTHHRDYERLIQRGAFRLAWAG